MNRFTKTCLSAFFFVLVMYHQQPGMNIGLLGCFLWILLLRDRGTRRRTPLFGLHSLLCWVAILASCWFADFYSYTALLVALMALGLYVYAPRLAIGWYPAAWLYNGLIFPFKALTFRLWLPSRYQRTHWMRHAALVIIPAVIGSIFLLLYIQGSRLFHDFFSGLIRDSDLSEILLLSVVGLLLMFNYWVIALPKSMLRHNRSIGDSFIHREGKPVNPLPGFPDLKTECRSGMITLMLLNALLVLFIAAYSYEQFFATQTMENLSGEVHQHVATVIISIVTAVAVLMLYFRSKTHFQAAVPQLSRLAHLWIMLNTLLVLLAIGKNYSYVFCYGLTFKRISVFIFLACCLIGLYLTHRKLKLQRTNSYLVNRMAWVIYVVFVACSGINFSWIVTRYNVSMNQADDSDYLQSLDFNKNLLYRTYRHEPGWQSYFENEAYRRMQNKTKGVLSRSLYDFARNPKNPEAAP